MLPFLTLKYNCYANHLTGCLDVKFSPMYTHVSRGWFFGLIFKSQRVNLYMGKYGMHTLVEIKFASWCKIFTTLPTNPNQCKLNGILHNVHVVECVMVTFWTWTALLNCFLFFFLRFFFCGLRALLTRKLKFVATCN